MKRGNNEEENGFNMPSIRLKYKGGKGGKSKINYGVVQETTKSKKVIGGGLNTIKEEKIIIQKETQSTRGMASSPLESTSKITTKTVIQGGDGGMSRQKVTITKTETSEQSHGSRARSGQKEAKGEIISRTTQQTTTSGNTRNGSQGRQVREEITTKTTTTTTNQGVRGQTSGKREVVKTVTNTTTENTSTQRRTGGGKEEITTTTTTKTNQEGGNRSRSVKQETTTTKTTTTNERQISRGQSQGKKEQVVKEVTQSTSVNRRNAPNQKQVTTTKTVTTANVEGQKSRTKEGKFASLAPSQTSQLKVEETRTNSRREQKQSTTERSLINQKSTPTLRINKEVTTKTTTKEKRPLSSKAEINTIGNITRIVIDDTGKIPKKEYVLNVRKLDRIQQNKRQRLLYASNLEKNNPVTTSFNHNITIIKKVTKELPTVADGPDGKTTQKYNKNTNIPNTIRIVINESGKIPKKTPVVSPRKNEVIRTFKKPFQLNYENYVETNTSSIQTGVKKIPIPVSKKTETTSSRIKTEAGGNKTTTTTTTTETKMRIGKNKSEANMNKVGERGSKVTVTKTEITTENNGGKGGRLQISRSGRNIAGNSSSTTEQKTTTVRESSRGKGGKVETVTTKEVVTERSGSKSRLEGQGAGSKVTTVKKTEISIGSGDNSSGRGRSRVKQETSSTTTTTTTKTVTKTSSKVEPVEGGGNIVRKFKATKRMKK